MVRTNYLTLLCMLGAAWFLANGLFAYDCSGTTASIWAWTFEGASTGASAATPTEACELARVNALFGETGVRLWTSFPALLVALVLVQLLMRHLSLKSR